MTSRKPRVAKLTEDQEFEATVWLRSPDTGKLERFVINKRTPSLSDWAPRTVMAKNPG